MIMNGVELRKDNNVLAIMEPHMFNFKRKSLKIPVKNLSGIDGRSNNTLVSFEQQGSLLLEQVNSRLTYLKFLGFSVSTYVIPSHELKNFLGMKWNNPFITGVEVKAAREGKGLNQHQAIEQSGASERVVASMEKFGIIDACVKTLQLLMRYGYYVVIKRMPQHQARCTPQNPLSYSVYNFMKEYDLTEEDIAFKAEVSIVVVRDFLLDKPVAVSDVYAITGCLGFTLKLEG
ncbi:hypothetical protein GR11A_00220 [Vibrio phage vB_VcorM_GR11A]|nr:hypothetical protein GR11A_00220 [Vibrio phage vB_VcorM_GR11A]